MIRASTDTIVIGAGIAGTCAALSLARRGAEVVLLEAGDFPRHKVCGEFLSPESRATFKRLGVDDQIVTAGALPVHAARVIAQTASFEVQLPPGALALSRYRLDETLWRAAAQQHGVTCHARTRVRHLDRPSHGTFEISTTKDTFSSRTVVGAPGRGAAWLSHHERDAKTTRHLGLKAHFRGAHLEPGVVELHPWRGGYCGLVRVEDGLTNVCLLVRYDVMHQRSRRTPEAFWQWLLANNQLLARRFCGAELATPWLATANVSFGRQAPTEAGVLHCGDAAGYIHPLAGDGMAMAARSGELAGAVTAAQLRGSIDVGDAATLYDAAWRREFSTRLQWADRLEPLLTSSLLTSIAVPVFARVPRLGQLAVGQTRGM